jgi:hypothetical protein
MQHLSVRERKMKELKACVVITTGGFPCKQTILRISFSNCDGNL